MPSKRLRISSFVEETRRKGAEIIESTRETTVLIGEETVDIAFELLKMKKVIIKKSNMINTNKKRKRETLNFFNYPYQLS